jgi:hypothetical protein
VSNITALSLSHSPVRHRADALHTLTERLLDLLVEHAPDDVSVNAEAFRTQLTAKRDELRHEEDDERVTHLTRAIAADCADFLDRTRTYHTDREVNSASWCTCSQAVDAVRGNSSSSRRTCCVRPPRWSAWCRSTTSAN